MTTSTSIRRLFSQCRLLGSGSQKIALSESEMFILLHLSVQDLGWDNQYSDLPSLSTPLPFDSYYQIPLPWFQSQENVAPTSSVLLSHFAKAIENNDDFGLYYHNLCSLHKRRMKYQRILSTQLKPSMDQIGPRSLLEYGICDSNFLFSWMTWRKWIFDIDNRAAQETGYLFEPILASCLGGESVSARHSPVKRLDETGNPTNKGRQIDCYIGHLDQAYEFKLRVTIAASGQGRFAEELSFPVECQAASLAPILLVLDPTPSSRLSELKRVFETCGGQAFVGEDAWTHMDQQAGEIMSVFLEKYIRPPLATMSNFDKEVIQNIRLSWTNESVILETSNETYEILRTN
ncbi:MAG: restriction endonuclease [Chloroflexi bacterium]|nr:MAG: restriction endonuclease [Chloroflexota bacterium]